MIYVGHIDGVVVVRPTRSQSVSGQAIDSRGGGGVGALFCTPKHNNECNENQFALKFSWPTAAAFVVFCFVSPNDHFKCHDMSRGCFIVVFVLIISDLTHSLISQDAI